MTPAHRDTLLQHAQAAITECEHGRGEILEAATLAGLLVRRDDAAGELLGKARALIAGQAAAVTRALAEELDALRGALDDLPPDADADERAELLLDLDELCAAAAFCGRAEEAAALVTHAVAAVHAEPAAWAALAPLARARLAELPPRAGDPATQLLHALEQTESVA